jgi:ATP-dependent exoDNAse (exonuclease V) beta subunit
MALSIPENGFVRISASAGSGKTFTLTRIFLQRILRSPMAYRSAVAITFTNKAAEELKERALKTLFQLATAPDAFGPDDHFGIPDPEVRTRTARQCLSRILHDFEGLQITTIDAFFQQLFSQLVYETGLPPGIQPELDHDLVKREVLVDGMKQMGDEEVSTLLENLMERLEESGKDWRPAAYIRKDLLDLLVSDQANRYFYLQKPKEETPASTQKAREILGAYINNLEKEILQARDELLHSFETLQLLPERLDSTADKDFISHYRTWKSLRAGGKLDEGIHKSHLNGKLYRLPKSRKLSEAELDILVPLIEQFALSRSPDRLANLKLARKLLRNVSAAGLLVFFRSVLVRINHSANRVLLSEIKYLLAGIVSLSDVPFLFERLGNQMDTLLVDEFQDTDRTQWDVLLPLVQSLIDNQGLVAVVGDVKQSIYGWRGADSSLFKSGVEKGIQVGVNEFFLETNYRSEKSVVLGNNTLFSTLLPEYTGFIERKGLLSQDPGWKSRLERNFEDVVQLVHPGAEKDATGFWELRFRKAPETNKSDDEEDDADDSPNPFSWLIPEIQRWQDAGFKAGDICVLLRKNKEVAEVAALLEKAAQEDTAGNYDYRFSAFGTVPVGSVLVFRFFIEAFHLAMYPTRETLFHSETLFRIGGSMGLSDTWTSGWADEWVKEAGPLAQDLSALFHKTIAWFQLGIHPDFHKDILGFQSIMLQYIRKDALAYPDFFDWWENKTSLKDLPMALGEGICLMTIHRSKGLDFPVVILPLKEEHQAISRNDFIWLNATQTPWNAYPLLRASVESDMFLSEVSPAVQEWYFNKSVENLNTFYVACTRPVQALVIDYQLKTKKNLPSWELGASDLGEMLFLLTDALKETGKFEWETNGGADPSIIQRCWKGRPSGKEVKKTDAVLESRISISFPDGKPFQIKETDKDDLPETRVGTALHKVLDQLKLGQNEMELADRLADEAWFGSAERESLKEHLGWLFSIPQVRGWLNDSDFQTFSELQLLSKQGKSLRADRVLIKDGKALILDFKTGSPEEAHRKQVSEYRQVFEAGSGLPTRAYLIYTRSQELVEVD